MIHSLNNKQNKNGENMNNSKWFIFSFLATMLIISSIPLSLYLATPSSPEPTAPTELALNKFSSYEELKTFIETSPQGNYYALGDTRGSPLKNSDALAAPTAPGSVPAPESSQTAGTVTTDYSKTNIQVEGVDEADIVKTDGEYIYVVSGNNVTIVKAYPPEEAKVVSKISLNGSIMGIFINGDKLAIFLNEYSDYLLKGVPLPVVESSVSGTEPASVPGVTVDDGTRVIEPANGSTPGVPDVPEPVNGSTPSDVPINPIAPMPIVWETPTTSIKVYDVSDKEKPVLARDFTIDGNYFDSRMIGDYVSQNSFKQ
jgi:hypothetical protein